MQNLSTEEYFYGAGSSAFQALDSSDNPTGPLLFVGNADSAKITLKVDRKEKRESQSGQNALVRSKVVQLGGDIEIVVSETQRQNLEMFLFGDTVTRGAVTGHEDENKIPALSQVGEIYRLEYQNVSSLVITDDGAADAVVATNKYEVDRTFGKVKVLADLGTGPFTVTYNAAAASIVPMFQHSDKALFYRHEGINIANDVDTEFLIEMYKIKLDPVSDLDLITDDFGKFTLKGQLIVSKWKPTDQKFGKFGRHIDLGAGQDTATLEIDTDATLPDGDSVPATPYFVIITASGGSHPYTWSLDSGALPDGLTLGASGDDAIIFGTPTVADDFTFTLKVTDGAAATATREFTLTVTS